MRHGELFIERLLGVAPELKEMYDEHVADNDVLLSHVFMGSVTRFVIASARDVDSLSVVQRLLDYFESQLVGGDAESIDLIRASFVENLIGEQMVVNKLKPMMGPALLREVGVVYRAGS